MSTPVSDIPIKPSKKGDEDDPIVSEIIKDMETKQQPMQQPQQPHQPQQQYQLPQHMPNIPIMSQMAQMPHMVPSNMPKPKKGLSHVSYSLWNPDNAKKAITFAVIAAIIFYPATFEAIFRTVPVLEKYLRSYLIFVQLLIVAVLIYIIINFNVV